jgi:hypothetical protein
LESSNKPSKPRPGSTDLASIRDDPRFHKIVADAKKRLGVGIQIATTALTPASSTRA